MSVFTDNPSRSQPIVDPDRTSTEQMFIWMVLVTELISIVSSGFTGVVTTAALTGGGVQGSMTFQNGILISQVQAT